ncbi:zf-HC2 domain-containing protein [Aneurinibacillus terranovensis]|uniref:zf-HC2 domain-containing protein n=1 Tax=Aneurinibacillus terranovensis TaxID=278991 RepID=UPI000418D5ED|nr:zf-HC2 domain-containing protein [Aneurinibacillus terranovensis]
MTCKEATYLLHDYLDRELGPGEEDRLREHLVSCTACKQHLHELKKSIALMRGLSYLKAPEGFTDHVMLRVPKRKKKLSWRDQMKNHPFLVAASLFIILMASSMMSSWVHGQGKFELSAPWTQHLKIDEPHHLVIVPAGQIVQGDIVVRNGQIKVNGDVNGNVVAIDGKVLQASTAHISGEVEEINKVLEWMWYNIKSVANYLVSGK